MKSKKLIIIAIIVIVLCGIVFIGHNISDEKTELKIILDGYPGSMGYKIQFETMQIDTDRDFTDPVYLNSWELDGKGTESAVYYADVASDRRIKKADKLYIRQPFVQQRRNIDGAVSALEKGIVKDPYGNDWFEIEEISQAVNGTDIEIRLIGKDEPTEFEILVNGSHFAWCRPQETDEAARVVTFNYWPKDGDSVEYKVTKGMLTVTDDIMRIECDGKEIEMVK